MVVFVCPPEHKHGANATCWGNHRCRCGDCREGQRVRMAARRRQIAYGRHEFTRSAAPAKRHIARLRASGWTVRDISRVSGVSVQTLNRVGLGTAGAVAPDVSKRILAVRISERPAPDLGGQLVDARGTVRRLQALAVMGYSGADVMRRIGSHPSYVATLLGGRQVFEGTRRRVADVYAELWDKPAEGATAAESALIRRTKARAKTLGWVGPLGWEDIDTDPEPVAVEESRDRAGWVVDELDHFRDIGESPEYAARALDRRPDSLVKLAHRYHRPDLAVWVQRAERKSAA